MTDELDVLRRERDVIEPDPEFRAELMDRLRHNMATGSDLAPGALTLTRDVPGSTTHEPPRTEVANGDAAAHRPRRPRGRWLVAVAAVIALFAVAAVMLFDDDQSVDTVPPVTEAPQPAPEPPVQTRPLPRASVQELPGRTVVSGSGCPFGISGDPVDLQLGQGSGRFDVEGGQGVAHLVLGSQTAEVHVPGFELHQQDAWHFEPVEVGSRSATIWLDGPESHTRGGGNLPFVQVRYFPDGDEPCSSFTVTVDGGTVDANRATAVDVAARVLLPSDLRDLDLVGTEGGPVAGLELPGTTWQVTGPSGRIAGALMTFTDTTVSWNDGCATVTADYELDRERGYLILGEMTSTDPGCTPPTHPEFSLGWDTLASMMGRDRIPVILVGSELQLGERWSASSLNLVTPG